jgi:hypothetical protein
MRAALAKRVRSGGSSTPAAAAGVLADGRLSRGRVAKRSLGMTAAAESMASGARWSLLPPVRLRKGEIGTGSASPAQAPSSVHPISSFCVVRPGPLKAATAQS